MNDPVEKPLCRVSGMLAPRAMCGHVIVGCKYCGYDGACEHKVEKVAAPSQGAKQ